MMGLSEVVGSRRGFLRLAKAHGVHCRYTVPELNRDALSLCPSCLPQQSRGGMTYVTSASTTQAQRRDSSHFLPPTSSSPFPSPSGIATMASRLETLAPELLGAILDAVTDTEYALDRQEDKAAQPSYHALCSTSRALQGASTPYLYRHYECAGASKCKERLWPFLRTLATRPELGKHVHSVVIRSCNAKAAVLASDGDTDLLSERLTSLSLEIDSSELLLAVRNGCFRAMTVAVILLTTHVRLLSVSQRALPSCHETMEKDDPRCLSDATIGARREIGVEEIRVDEIPCDGCLDVGSWLANVFATPIRSRYTKLTQVEIVGKPSNQKDFELARLFLCLPAIKSLTCFGFGTTEESNTWEPGTMPPSTAGTLHILDSWPCTADLIGTLKFIRHLRELEVRWVEPDVTDTEADWVAPPTIQLAAVLQALRAHSDTLQTLNLQNISTSGIVDGDIATHLISFSTLRHLTIDQKLLVGPHMWEHADLGLPCGLRTLMIMTEGNVDQLSGITLALGRAQCKALTALTVCFPVHEGLNEEWTGSCDVVLTPQPTEEGSNQGSAGQTWHIVVDVCEEPGYREVTIQFRGEEMGSLCASIGRDLHVHGIDFLRLAAASHGTDMGQRWKTEVTEPVQ